jgi:hypothetical protein
LSRIRSRGSKFCSCRPAGGLGRWAAVLGVLALTTLVRGELQWSERRVELEPPVGASETVGTFECTNRGTAPIRVIEIRSGCGCTLAGFDREVIAPGERATLHAIYQIGDRQGRQSVTITVTTAEPAIVRHDLVLEVTIKDVVVVTPRSLVWRIGDDATAKVLLVQPAPGFAFVGVESTVPEFTVEEVGREHGTIRLRAQPRDTWAKRSASVRIRLTQGAKGVPTVFLIALQVR